MYEFWICGELERIKFDELEEDINLVYNVKSFFCEVGWVGGV